MRRKNEEKKKKIFSRKKSGKLWKNLEESGRIWKDLERVCQAFCQVWKNLEESGKFWKTLEESGRRPIQISVFLRTFVWSPLIHTKHYYCTVLSAVLIAAQQRTLEQIEIVRIVEWSSRSERDCRELSRKREKRERERASCNSSSPSCSVADAHLLLSSSLLLLSPLLSFLPRFSSCRALLPPLW